MKKVLALKSKANQQKREYEEQRVAAQKVLEATYDNPVELNAETLTLGCEFECILSSYKPGLNEKDEKWGREQIAKALSQPHQATCSGCGQTFNHKLKVKLREERDDYNYWQVDKDGSISTNHHGLVADNQATYYQFSPIEIKSRILRFDETADMAKRAKHFHWLAYDQEIRYALDRLNEGFKGRDLKARGGLCLITTNETGFHVHVGNGRGIPIPFNVMKRVFSVSLACEKQIDGLHSKDRIGGTMAVSEELTEYPTAHTDMAQLIQEACKNKPLSYEFLRAAHKSRWDLFRNVDIPRRVAFHIEKEQLKYGYDIGSWLELIGTADDVDDLKNLVPQINRYCVLNVSEYPSKREPLSNLKDRMLTIEFRQHMGTLQSEVALPFIDVVANLVLKCGTITKEEFGKAIGPGGILRDVKMSTTDFCEWVECKGSSFKFYKGLLSGAIDPVKDYLHDEVEKDSTAMASSGLYDRAPLRASLKERVSQTDQGAVQGRILDKLKKGGYGQYSEEDLEILVPGISKVNKYRHLRLGYRSKVSQALLNSRGKEEKSKAPELGKRQQLDQYFEDHVNDPVRRGSSSARASKAELAGRPPSYISVDQAGQNQLLLGASAAGSSKTKDTMTKVWWKKTGY